MILAAELGAGRSGRRLHLSRPEKRMLKELNREMMTLGESFRCTSAM